MSKQSDLGVRTRTAIVFGVAVIGSIVLHYGTYLALMAAVMLFSINEYLNIIAPRFSASKVQGLYKKYALAKAVAVFAISAAVALGYLSNAFLALIPLVFFGFFILELFGEAEHPFQNVGYNLLGWTFLVTPFIMLNLLVLSPGGGYAYKLVLGTLFLIWANDVFAYTLLRWMWLGFKASVCTSPPNIINTLVDIRNTECRRRQKP